jgi:prevent-host-death family protein
MEIRSSTSLRNQYNEISDYCKQTGEPIFLTKNGDGDLVVMSIDAFKKKEEILKIKEALLEVKLSRANGTLGYSLEDLDSAIKEILAK